MLLRLDQIVVDSSSPAEAARFWAALLGGQAVDRDRGWAHVAPRGLPKISFQPASAPAGGHDRLHLDFEVDDVESAAVAAQALGAQRHGAVVTGPLGSCQVLSDPWGVRFCFVSD